MKRLLKFALLALLPALLVALPVNVQRVGGSGADKNDLTSDINADDGIDITYSGTGTNNARSLQGIAPTAAGLAILGGDDATAQRDALLIPTTFESGIAAMFAARGAVPVTTDIPAVTFTGPGGSNPITGVDYVYNTTSVNRLGGYLVTVPVSAVNYQQNQVNGQTGADAQPWAVEFDTYSPDIVMPFVSSTISARIWCWVDGRPVSEMAPDQTANITSGSASWYRLRFTTTKLRRIRLYLVACDFGGVTVPTGYTIVANPKSEVRRLAFVGDSWGGESGRMKFPYVIPYFLGRMLGWETAHCSIGGSGYVAGTNFSTAARITGRNTFAPHYVVVFGSINDTAQSPAAVQAAATAYYAGLASDLPSTRIIVVGPQPVTPGYETNAGLLANRDAVKTAALAAANVLGFVDLIEGRVFRGAGNVDSDDAVGDGNTAQLVANDNTHPIVGGASFIAQRMFEEIFRLLEQADRIRSTAGANDVVPTLPSLVGWSPALGGLTLAGNLQILSTATAGARIWETSDTANSAFMEWLFSGTQFRFRATRASGSGQIRGINLSTLAGAEYDIGAAASSIGSHRFTQGSTSTANASLIGASFTTTAASGVSTGANIVTTVSQSGTAGHTGIRSGIVEAAVGSGEYNLFAGYAGAAGTTEKFRVDRTGAVTATSFAGSGAPLTGITGTQVANTPAGSIAATTEQAAINELDSEKLAVTGTAVLATALATPRIIAITGDLTWTSPSFDGSGNVTAAGTLATVASAGTTGSSTAIPVVTINAKGLTTSIATAAVVAPAGTLTGATLASGVTASSLTSFGASPALGAATATTAAVDTNTTHVATTAFVVGQGYAKTAALPTATTPLATYASGTAYSLTASDAALDFGTTDPTVTFATSGTYLVLSRAYMRYNGATYVANQTATLHLRRTNNTPADIPNAATTPTLRIVSTLTDTVGVMEIPAAIYTATAGDVLSVYGSVSATPAAGSVDCTEASIVAVRLY